MEGRKRRMEGDFEVRESEEEWESCTYLLERVWNAMAAYQGL